MFITEKNLEVIKRKSQNSNGTLDIVTWAYCELLFAICPSCNNLSQIQSLNIIK